MFIKLESALVRNQTLMRWHSTTIGFYIDAIISKALVIIFFGYCTVSFSLLRTDLWWSVYRQMYFIGHLIFGLWPLYGRFVKQLIAPRKPRKLSDSSPQPSTSKQAATNGVNDKKSE